MTAFTVGLVLLTVSTIGLVTTLTVGALRGGTTESRLTHPTPSESVPTPRSVADPANETVLADDEIGRDPVQQATLPDGPRARQAARPALRLVADARGLSDRVEGMVTSPETKAEKSAKRGGSAEPASGSASPTPTGTDETSADETPSGQGGDDSGSPSPEPSEEPTDDQSAEPTPGPTSEPTSEPASAEPTSDPTTNGPASPTASPDPETSPSLPLLPLLSPTPSETSGGSGSGGGSD